MSFDYLAIAILVYIIGFVSGFLAHKFLGKEALSFNNDERINWLILLVSLVWLFSVVFDIISPTYETSPLIHGIMGAIVGFFFFRPK